VPRNALFPGRFSFRFLHFFLRLSS
jgi:hypothetical protein